MRAPSRALESLPDPSYRYPDSAPGPGCKSADDTGAFIAATAPKGPSKSRACSDLVAKSTCSPSSSMKRAINGAGPSLRNFLRSDAVGESVTASRTGISDSAHAAGLPETRTRHAPKRRIPVSTATCPAADVVRSGFRGGAGLHDCAPRGPRAPPRTTRAEHRSVQGSPRSSLLPRRLHRLPQPNH